MREAITVRWADVVPARLRPGPVEQAVAETTRLAARVREERGKVDDAAAALEQASAEDTARMAEQLRAGREPKSQVAQVEATRAALAEAERRLAAAELASSAADRDLGQLVAEHADTWGTQCSVELERARSRARKALQQAEQALDEIADLGTVANWVAAVDERPRPMHAPGVARARSSEKVTANRQPLNARAVLRFARELVDPAVAAADLEIAS